MGTATAAAATMTVNYPPNSFYPSGAFKVWFSGPGGWPSGYPVYFNSALSTKSVSTSSNATLTIYLRLLLVPRNPGDSGVPIKNVEGDEVELDPWDDVKGEFKQFKDDVKVEAEKYWNNAGFCLLLPDDYRGLDWPHTARPMVHPNVDCRFEIVWADGVQDAHAVIDCLKPSSYAKSINFMNPHATGSTGQVSNKSTMPAGAGLTRVCGKEFIVLKDGSQRPIDKKCPILQTTIVHEIGHLLGMPHVGEFRKAPDCLKSIQRGSAGLGPNSLACLVPHQVLDDDAENVMGRGMKVANWNALPWAIRLVDHIGIHPGGVRIALASVPPKPIQP